jgi:hypothetical protein
LVENAFKNRRAVEDQLEDFVMELHRKGHSPGYISNYIKSVKSWLDFNEIRLVRKIRVGNLQATPTVEDEQVPTQEELRLLFSYAGERAKVSIAFMAFSGIRPQVLGNADGTDGLRLKHLPELYIEGEAVHFKKTPTIVYIPASLSKARHKYFTFLPLEGQEYLKAYLEKRIARGEKLRRDAPVIAAAPGFERMGKRSGSKNYGSPFIETQNITREIRQAMRPRFTWRPYVLRAYFDTQLLLAESKGKISHAYRQFFMGHKGDIEARYTTNKGRLPPDLIEDMRNAYQASSSFLITSPMAEPNVKEMLLQMWRSQAESYGIDPMRVRIEKAIEPEKLEPEEEIKLLQLEIVKRTAPHLVPAGTTYTNNTGGEHKIILENELVEHLDSSWELVKDLPNGKFLIKKIH